MGQAERLARLRLIRTEGVGPVGFRQLLQRCGTAAAALEALPELKPGARLADAGAVAAEAAALDAMGGRFLHLGDADYPRLLAEMADAPPVLAALGDAALGGRRVVAIVGARNASAAGRTLARTLAAALGEAGFVVASGMARGIDAAAHEGSLATGAIACIASGADRIYPPENAGLQEDVAAAGLLLAEQPLGTEPQARHFPRRNRLIVGVAEALLVVEAAEGSGSLISARIAGELGREVMAVPGHPADPRSRGGNRLIREGAALVETVDDILAVLEPFQLPAPPPKPIRLARRPAAAPEAVGAKDTQAKDTQAGDAAGRFMELLGATPVAVDELVRQSGLPAGEVMGLLADLEIAGKIARHAGGRIALA